MSEYYMLECWGFEIDGPIEQPVDIDYDDWQEEHGINDDNVDFWLGRSLKELNIPNPIQMQWDELEWEESEKPNSLIGPKNENGFRRKYMYDVCEPPLFHKELVASLIECGVSNMEMETFDVQISDQKTKVICNDYLAVNLVGLVKAADLGRSKLKKHSETGLYDTDFDALVLNKDKIPAQRKIFRLAESVNAVVIHRSVKEYLESKGGFDLDFVEPKDWIG